MGNVISKIPTDNYIKERQDYLKELAKEEARSERLEESSSFTLMRYAKKYDDFFLDPIVGFIIPGFGDLLSSAASFPALYVAIFKVRSVVLTLAILSGTIIDLIIGVIPVVGDVADALYKSNKRAYRLTVGYVENDPDIKAEVNRRAVTGCIIVVVLCFIIWAFFEMVKGLIHWFGTLF